MMVIPSREIAASVDAWLASSAAQLGLTIEAFAEKYELIEYPSEIITKADGSLVVRAVYRLAVRA